MRHREDQLWMKDRCSVPAQRMQNSCRFHPRNPGDGAKSRALESVLHDLLPNGPAGVSIDVNHQLSMKILYFLSVQTGPFFYDICRVQRVT